MNTITTKYAIGDTVWHATTQSTRAQHPCPDCLGSRKWSALSPAGAEYSFACPRCPTSYQSNRDINLDYTKYTPCTQRLTIGSVRVDTSSSSDQVSYMCCETGVGSGTVYYESRLFSSEEDAFAAAQLIANEQNTTLEWVVKLYDKSLEISDYQLTDAIPKARELADVSFRYRVEDLLDGLREASSIEAVTEAIEEYDRKSA